MSERKAPPSSVENQLWDIRRDLGDIRKILLGDREQNKKGLDEKVDGLSIIADRGQWSLKVALWIGGSTVAVLTAFAQAKNVINQLFGGAH